MPKRKTTEEFIEDAIKVHGDEYDYSKVNYVNNNTKVEIICKEHGSFWVLPRIHLTGCKCGKCKGVSSDRDYFIQKAKEIHGDKYDYDKVVYEKANKKVCIICNVCGTEFLQTPNSHLDGHGCPECAKKAISEFHKGELLYGVGINDDERYCVDENGNYYPAYSAWVHMLKRCYDDKYQSTHQTYIGCYVDERWYSYKAFRLWFEDEARGYKDGYELEKDIKVHGNKVYSPENCLIVPRFINTLFTKADKIRGNTMIGVTATKNGNYSARLAKGGEQVYLGRFATEMEAFLAYKREKEKYIKEVADKYYKDGLIAKEVYDALYRYEVMEDD